MSEKCRSLAMVVPPVRMVVVAVVSWTEDGEPRHDPPLFLPVLAIRSILEGDGGTLRADLLIWDTTDRYSPGARSADELDEYDGVTWEPALCSWPPAEDPVRLAEVVSRLEVTYETKSP